MKEGTSIPQQFPEYLETPLDTTPEYYDYERVSDALQKLEDFSRDVLGVELRIIPFGNPSEMYETVHGLTETIKKLPLTDDEALSYRRMLFGLQSIAETYAKVLIIDPFEEDASARDVYREALEKTNPGLYHIYEEFNALRMNKITGTMSSVEPLVPIFTLLDEGFEGNFGSIGDKFKESFGNIRKEVIRRYKKEPTPSAEKVEILEEFMEEVRRLFDTVVFALRGSLDPGNVDH